MPITVYGLKNCDTCKKARKWLEHFELAHTFVDYREHALTPETLQIWAEKRGGFSALINKSSTTWRQLPDHLKSASDQTQWQALLIQYPQLMRRPLLVMEDSSIHQGFSDARFKQLFAIAS